MALNPTKKFHCVKEITHVLTTEHIAPSRMYMENRPWYGISLAIDGKIVYKHNGKRYTSDTDHIVFLPKNQSYELECVESGSFLLINFILDEDIEEDAFHVIKASSPETIIALFKKAEREFSSYQKSSYLKTLACLYELFALIREEEEKNFIPFVLKAALDIVDNQISDPNLSNVFIASEVHISEVYLRKLFLSYLSKTPKSHIQDIRFSRAQELLTNSACKISVISEKCGYTTVGMFCRAFRKRFGMTPTEYRERNRNQII